MSATGLKVKHLALLPLLGIVQIIMLMYYVETSDTAMDHHEKHFSKQYAGPVRWQWKNSDFVNDEYRVHRHFRRAKRKVAVDDITLVSQCSVDNLHHIPALVKRWSGPVSIAIFAPGDDAVLALYGVDILRQCEPAVADWVAFHILYPTAMKPRHSEPQRALLSEDCRESMKLLDGLKLDKKNYQRHDGIKYPQNSLRNLARDEVESALFYLVDIDTVPVANLRLDFTKFAKSRGLFTTGDDSMEAYITPAYEIKAHLNFPEDKEQLLSLVDQGHAQPFHVKTCTHCHAPTKYTDWQSLRIRANQLATAYSIDYYSSYEPFYIAKTQSTPYYDERFKAYGYDRISQVCEMHVKGFDFHVLNNAFIFHIGFKAHAKMHPSKNAENALNMVKFKNEFKPLLRSKYPSSKRECLDDKSGGAGGQAVVEMPVFKKNNQKAAIALSGNKQTRQMSDEERAKHEAAIEAGRRARQERRQQEQKNQV